MHMNNHKLKVFSGRANIPLAEKIAHALGDPLGKIYLGNFPDGHRVFKGCRQVRATLVTDFLSHPADLFILGAQLRS